jgi:hypothetical protein
VSRPRLLATRLALHDVRDVESHVRALLDSRLAEWGARLDPDLYDDALTYLVTKCWELSGLDVDGRQRRVYVARIHSDGDPDDDGHQIGPYPTRLQRDDAVVQLLDLQPGLVAELVTISPAGAFDPQIGLAFSTYSRRILSARVVDWYRQTFGDARYGTRIREVSLDVPHDDDQPTLGDRPDLAAAGQLEEVLTRVALDR